MSKRPVEITKVTPLGFEVERPPLRLEEIAEARLPKPLPLPEAEPFVEEKNPLSFSAVLSVAWEVLKRVPLIITAVAMKQPNRLVAIGVSLAVALISHFFGLGSDWVVPFSDLFVEGGLTLSAALTGLGLTIAALFVKSPTDAKAEKEANKNGG